MKSLYVSLRQLSYVVKRLSTIDENRKNDDLYSTVAVLACVCRRRSTAGFCSRSCVFACLFVH